MRFKLLLILIIFAFSLSGGFAQQIQSEVKIILERLPLEKQEKLRDFGEEIELYINNIDWTGETLEEPIPILIQIFLNDKSVDYEDRYSGTFLITNNSDIQYYDKYWYFPYQIGDILDHNEGMFHALTGFIDFYVNLIIASEYDKFGKFLGSPYFDKSKQINEQAQFDSRYISGWRERTRLIEYLYGEDYQLFREMKDLFYLGLSYVGDEDNTARKYCRQSLTMLEKILTENSDMKEANQFLQAHHLKFIELFEDNNEVLKNLIFLDPEREDTYRQYMD